MPKLSTSSFHDAKTQSFRHLSHETRIDLLVQVLGLLPQARKMMKYSDLASEFISASTTFQASLRQASHDRSGTAENTDREKFDRLSQARSAFIEMSTRKTPDTAHDPITRALYAQSQIEVASGSETLSRELDSMLLAGLKFKRLVLSRRTQSIDIK